MRLSVRDLTFAYRKTPVLRGVGFTADAGELLAILGKNGVGKTTLFRCILGEQKRYTGAITLDGTDAKTLSARETARRVAYIPQAHPAAFRFSVFDTVLTGTTHTLSPFASPGARQREAARAALGRIGIGHLRDRDLSELSGGEQQLVYIARALAQQAQILLMDEPTASLDVGNRRKVLSVARSLADEGYTVLFTTHEPQYALSFADRVLALHDGRVAAFGDPRSTVSEALLETLYGTPLRLLDTQYGRMILPCDQEERL